MIGPLLALALSASPGCGLPPLAGGAPPWPTGETLSFDLDLFGTVKAATLELSVERPMAISGGRIVPLRARAKSDPSVRNLKRLTALGLSWVDVKTLVPEHYREEAEEDGVHKVSDARLSPPGPRIDIAYQVGGRSSAGHFPREGAVLDAISAAYYLRAARLAPGDRFCFDLVARGRVWRVEGVVAAKREKLDTAVGKLETIRLDAKARLADQDGAPSDVHVWLSTDSRRLFVAAVGEIDAGPVRAMLTGVRGARAN